MYFTRARADGTLASPIAVPLCTAGKNDELQLFTPPNASVGQIVTKAGRFSFSVPSP
ncbi:MAG: hypothetical protein CM1200mP2_16440 [Planctomycetaceae bacterium]|nr:MAG: hypothetical protein CM1200mP2_16440 [Planctomycetaceae bacterium]